MEQRIAEKAKELFYKYGLKSVTMDDIASNLGVSKKTIYQYYADKDALIDAVMQLEIDNDVKECAFHATVSENPVHEVFMALDMMQEILSTMNPAIIFEMQKYHPAAFKKMNDHKNKFLFQVIKENLEKGMEEGYYRADIIPDILAKFRIESIFIAFNQDLFPTGKYTVFQVQMIVMEHFLYGICTSKGQKLIIKYKKQREKTNTL